MRGIFLSDVFTPRSLFATQQTNRKFPLSIAPDPASGLRCDFFVEQYCWQSFGSEPVDPLQATPVRLLISL